MNLSRIRHTIKTRLIVARVMAHALVRGDCFVNLTNNRVAVSHGLRCGKYAGRVELIELRLMSGNKIVTAIEKLLPFGVEISEREYLQIESIARHACPSKLKEAALRHSA